MPATVMPTALRGANGFGVYSSSVRGSSAPSRYPDDGRGRMQYAGAITPVSAESRSVPRPPANAPIRTGSIRADVARYNEERGSSRAMQRQVDDPRQPEGRPTVTSQRAADPHSDTVACLKLAGYARDNPRAASAASAANTPICRPHDRRRFAVSVSPPYLPLRSATHPAAKCDVSTPHFFENARQQPASHRQIWSVLRRCVIRLSWSALSAPRGVASGSFCAMQRLRRRRRRMPKSEAVAGR